MYLEAKKKSYGGYVIKAFFETTEPFSSFQEIKYFMKLLQKYQK